jgi:hypothetical protein
MEPIYSLLILLGLALGVCCILAGAYLLYMRMRGIETLAHLPRIGGIGTFRLGLSLISAGGYFLTNATLSYFQFQRSLELESKVNQLLVKEAGVMRKEFTDTIRGLTPPITPEKFAKVSFYIDFMREIDPTNGHASYFAGEVARLQGALERSHDYFYQHLEVMDKHAQKFRDGGTGSEICYERPRGFCLQRAGWIHHLLANDFFEEGLAFREPIRRLERFELALTQAEAALRDFPPRGFEQYCPTPVLLKWLTEQIKALKEEPGAAAGNVASPCTPRRAR